MIKFSPVIPATVMPDFAIKYDLFRLKCFSLNRCKDLFGKQLQNRPNSYVLNMSTNL